MEDGDQSGALRETSGYIDQKAAESKFEEREPNIWKNVSNGVHREALSRNKI